MTESKNKDSNALIWLSLSLVLIALDQWTKTLAVQHLAFQQPVPVIPGFWNWMLTHNTGAAFSFLAGAGGWQHWLFTAIAIVVSTVLMIWLARIPRGDWRSALPFAMIVAGALGNVIDRLRLGYVIDFIQWYWRDFFWPVFNIADSSLVVGASLMVLLSLTSKEKTP